MAGVAPEATPATATATVTVAMAVMAATASAVTPVTFAAMAGALRVTASAETAVTAVTVAAAGLKCEKSHSVLILANLWNAILEIALLFVFAENLVPSCIYHGHTVYGHNVLLSLAWTSRCV